MVIELIMNPLYKILKHKLGSQGNLSNIMTTISAFHAELQREIKERREKAEKERKEKEKADAERAIRERERLLQERMDGGGL